MGAVDKMVEMQSPNRLATLDVANSKEIHRHVSPAPPISPHHPALVPSISEGSPPVNNSRQASSIINLDASVLGLQPPSHASPDSSKAAGRNTTTVQTMTKKQRKKQKKLMKRQEAAAAGVPLLPATVANTPSSGTECNSNIGGEPSSCKSSIPVTRMSPDKGVAASASNVQPAITSTRIPSPAPTTTTAKIPETTAFQSDLKQSVAGNLGTKPVGPLAMKAGVYADSVGISGSRNTSSHRSLSSGYISCIKHSVCWRNLSCDWNCYLRRSAWPNAKGT